MYGNTFLILGKRRRCIVTKKCLNGQTRRPDYDSTSDRAAARRNSTCTAFFDNSEKSRLYCSAARDGVGCDTHNRHDQFAIKDKLPKGFSYPLKHSVLDSALASTQLAELPLIRFGRQGGGTIMRAWFPGESTRGVGNRVGSGQIQLSIYAVPSGQRQAVEQVLVAQSLPALCAWLHKVENAGNVWRAIEHDFTCYLAEGELKIDND